MRTHPRRLDEVVERGTGILGRLGRSDHLIECVPGISPWLARPEQIIEWFRTFRKAGVDHFICRFGSLDQFGQVERFAKEILPVLRAEG